MPSTIETLDPGNSTLLLSLDVELYPREILYAAAYIFLDRAYVLLDRLEGRFVVQVRGKQPLSEAELSAMAGEFENELLAQALRHAVVRANQGIIESVTALAITGASSPNRGRREAQDEAVSFHGDDDSGDFLDDPLGIATPWEKKPDVSDK